MDTRELAFADWRKGMKYKEIAEKYGVSLSAVKSWAVRDWKHRKDAAVCNQKMQPRKKKPRPKGGAPPGNKNAALHGAPVRNRNSLKHGIYAQVFWDVLDGQEQEMINDLPDDEMRHLLDEVCLLTVRERRLMKILQKPYDAENDMILLDRYQNLVFKANAELTKVQATKMRCVEAINKIRLEYEKAEENLKTGKMQIDIFIGDEEF